jgi:hypothetical protein
MLHNVSGYAAGTADEHIRISEIIRSLEATLIDIYSKKTGKTVDEIKNTYFDNQDHWLTAEQALAAGLIDGIVDANDDYEPLNNSIDEIYNYKLTNRMKPLENFTALNLVPKNMTKIFQKLGLENSTDENKAIERIEQIERENAELKTKNDELQKRIDEVEKRNKDFAEKEVENKIETTLQGALKEGRIQETQKEHFKAILKVDFNNGSALLNSMPASKRLMSELQNATATDKFKDYSFKDYQKNAAKELERIKTDEPERYKALYKAEFGKEAVI